MWPCLVECRGQLDIVGTTGLLLVQATGCATTHRPRTSGVSTSELVHCMFSGLGTNAFGMGSSNLSLSKKSCTCASIAFLSGIFSWSMISMVLWFILISDPSWYVAQMVNNNSVNHLAVYCACIISMIDTHTHFGQMSPEFHGCPTNFVQMWISDMSELLRMLIPVHRFTVLYNTVKCYNCSHYSTFMLCLYCN